MQSLLRRLNKSPDISPDEQMCKLKGILQGLASEVGRMAQEVLAQPFLEQGSLLLFHRVARFYVVNNKSELKSKRKLLKFILGIVDQQELIKINFEKKGYRLPEAYTGIVEGLRTRTSNERPYDYYWKEVHREEVLLQYQGKYWSPQHRKSLKKVERSKYLDILELFMQNKDFSENPLYASYLKYELDPNSLILAYYQQYHTPEQQERNLKYHQLIEQARLEDVRAQQDRILHIYERYGDIRPGNLIAILEMLSVDLGGKLVHKGAREPKVVFEYKLADEISIYLSWTERRVLADYGELLLFYHFLESDSAHLLLKGNYPFLFSGIYRFLPGGKYYIAKKCKDSAALSALAHIDLIHAIREALGLPAPSQLEGSSFILG